MAHSAGGRQGKTYQSNLNKLLSEFPLKELFKIRLVLMLSQGVCLIHTNVCVHENGCVHEKDKYLNHLFHNNFDRYVKYVILVNE